MGTEPNSKGVGMWPLGCMFGPLLLTLFVGGIVALNEAAKTNVTFLDQIKTDEAWMTEIGAHKPTTAEEWSHFAMATLADPDIKRRYHECFKKRNVDLTDRQNAQSAWKHLDELNRYSERPQTMGRRVDLVSLDYWEYLCHHSFSS